MPMQPRPIAETVRPEAPRVRGVSRCGCEVVMHSSLPRDGPGTIVSVDRPLTVPESPPLTRRVLGAEVVVVFAVSLGASGLFALIRFVGDLAEKIPLSQQRAV